MNYELFMAEAIAEARRGAEAGEAPIGSVAVIDDAMIARDHDHSMGLEDPTAHAVLLTRQAAAGKLGPRRLVEATIFTSSSPFPTSSAGPPAASSSWHATRPCRISSRSSPGSASRRRRDWRRSTHRSSAASSALNSPVAWRGVRVVEGAALEKRCAGNRTVGSNPTLSATQPSRRGEVA